jgi:hypothetical protein
MSQEEKDGFKVIDRRSSSGAKDEPQPTGGPGFTMKEAENEAALPPDEIDFSTLVFSLATGAFIHLGLAADPVTQKTEKNLPLAKQNIDILDMLQKKTKGNLSPEELQLLDGLLAELHLRYVESAR